MKKITPDWESMTATFARDNGLHRPFRALNESASYIVHQLLRYKGRSVNVSAYHAGAVRLLRSGKVSIVGR